MEPYPLPLNYLLREQGQIIRFGKLFRSLILMLRRITFEYGSSFMKVTFLKDKSGNYMSDVLQRDSNSDSQQWSYVRLIWEGFRKY